MTSQKCTFFNKLLLPTDGSNHSLKAASYAAELAKICDSEVTILHVLKMSIADHPIEIETDSWVAPIDNSAQIRERGEKVMEMTARAPEQEKQYLEQAVESLEEELEAIKKRLEEIGEL